AKNSGGRAILFVENLDALLSARDEQQAQSALHLLAAGVARGNVRLIATVSTAAFELKLAHDDAFRSQLQEIYLDKTEQASNSDEEESDSSDNNQSNGAGFVGDKISPDLSQALAGGSDRARIIMQGDDMKNEAVR